MPSEAVSFPHHNYSTSSSLNIPPKQLDDSFPVIYEGKGDSLSLEPLVQQQNEWNRHIKTDESSQRFLHYTPHYAEQSRSFGRSNLILPPPSSLMPPHELADFRPPPPLKTSQGYSAFVHQSEGKQLERTSKRKRNRSLPPPIVSTPGYHYQVLNMAKRKRSKRDATAAETLASFSRLSPSTGPYYSAEGPRCGGDEYKHNRGRGESSYHDSQTLVIEVRNHALNLMSPFAFSILIQTQFVTQAARILCALSTRR
jgi:hypothetical protein